MRRLVLATTAICAAAMIALPATPASAALVAVAGGECNVTTPDPNAVACAGAFAGNLNNNASIADLNAALDILVGGDFTPDALWADLDPTKAFFSTGAGTTLNFADTLFGEQIISMHFGDGGTGLGNRTILYVFDFGVVGATSIVLNTNGWSNAVLITPESPIPEPRTWAMMLLGFGAAGYAMRRRRRNSGEILQLA